MSHSPAEDYGPLIEALSSLQARRHPLEERLKAIEEKRGATAPAVYEKVKRETLEKLHQLDGEMAALTGAAGEARSAVVTRTAQLEQELARANEGLEEVRFRNTLGEYTPEQYRQAEAEALQAVEEYRARLQALAEVGSLLDGFLTSAGSPPPPPPAAAAPPPTPIPALAAPTGAPALTAPPQPTPPPRPAASPLSEMEALFGSAPAPPPRLADLPPLPSLGEPGTARDRDETRSAPSFPSLKPVPEHGEETTEDLKIRAAAAGRPAFPAAAPAGPFRPTLIVKTKDRDRGEDTYELASGHTLIGRAPENDIILLEESVSRRHARLTVENQEVFYEDLGSANGSFINGERLKPKAPRKLQDNDVIKMGQLLALFRLSAED